MTLMQFQRPSIITGINGLNKNAVFESVGIQLIFIKIENTMLGVYCSLSSSFSTLNWEFSSVLSINKNNCIVLGGFNVDIYMF